MRNPALCAFKRIRVKAGEKAEAKLLIRGRAFSVVNEKGERIKDGSHFDLYAATSQPDKRSVELTGTEPVRLRLAFKNA